MAAGCQSLPEFVSQILHKIRRWDMFFLSGAQLLVRSWKFWKASHDNFRKGLAGPSPKKAQRGSLGEVNVQNVLNVQKVRSFKRGGPTHWRPASEQKLAKGNSGRVCVHSGTSCVDMRPYILCSRRLSPVGEAQDHGPLSPLFD